VALGTAVIPVKVEWSSLVIDFTSLSGNLTKAQIRECVELPNTLKNNDLLYLVRNLLSPCEQINRVLEHKETR
jgi:hypothetical protein